MSGTNGPVGSHESMEEARANSLANGSTPSWVLRLGAVVWRAPGPWDKPRVVRGNRELSLGQTESRPWDKPRSSLGQTGLLLFHCTVNSPDCPVCPWDSWGSSLGQLSHEGRRYALALLRSLCLRMLVGSETCERHLKLQQP